MEAKELNEAMEKSHETGQRIIGLSMALFAVLLATATMLSHRSHTEEILQETLATDQWAYYQAKDIRSHVYEADASLATMFGTQGAAMAADFVSQGKKQRSDADQIELAARNYEKEVARATRRAAFYDAAELMLEVSIVLCSISLLSASRLYWRISFLFAVGGLATSVWGIMLKA